MKFRTYLLIVSIIQIFSTWSFANGLCSQIHITKNNPPITENDVLNFESLSVTKPWHNSDERLSEFTKRAARKILETRKDDLEKLISLGGSARAVFVGFEQIPIHRKGRRGIFFDNEGELNYVQKAKPEDLELIDLSDIHGAPIEAFRFRVSDPKSSQVYSEPTVSGHTEVSAEHFVEAWRKFKPILESGNVKISKKALLPWRTSGFLELVHSHPHHSFRIDLEVGPNSVSIPALWPLSPQDRASGRSLSLMNPGILVLMTAVVPNGYKFMGLFLNGKDVTDKIESYLDVDAL